MEGEGGEGAASGPGWPTDAQPNGFGTHGRADGYLGSTEEHGVEADLDFEPAVQPDVGAFWHSEADWPRIRVACKERPALDGTYDVLYAGTRRHNGRPVWACGPKRIYSHSADPGVDPGHWAVAVGSDAPLTGKRHLQSVHPRGEQPAAPHLCVDWEWFDSDADAWRRATGTRVTLADQSEGSAASGALLPEPAGSQAFAPAYRANGGPEHGELLPEFMPPPLSEPGPGCVVSVATVRAGASLESEIVCEALPQGTVVQVAEVQGRRARIVDPVEGWLSLHTQGCTLVAAAALPPGRAAPAPVVRCTALGCDLRDDSPLVVAATAPGGPADAAGLEAGDTVVWVADGKGAELRMVNSADDVSNMALRCSTLEVAFLRQGKNHTCVIAIPPPAPPPRSPPRPAHPVLPGPAHEAGHPHSGAAPAPRPAAVCDALPAHFWREAACRIPAGDGAVARTERRKLFSLLCPALSDGPPRGASARVTAADCWTDDALVTAVLREPPPPKTRDAWRRAISGAFAATEAVDGIDRRGFRPVLEALRRHAELYQVFGHGRRTLATADFARAVPLLVAWGCPTLEAEAAFSAASGETGVVTCSFDSFCIWAAKQELADAMLPRQRGRMSASPGSAVSATPRPSRASHSPLSQRRASPRANGAPIPPQGAARGARSPRPRARGNGASREQFGSMTPPRQRGPVSGAAGASPAAQRQRVASSSAPPPRRGVVPAPREPIQTPPQHGAALWGELAGFVPSGGGALAKAQRRQLFAACVALQQQRSASSLGDACCEVLESELIPSRGASRADRLAFRRAAAASLRVASRVGGGPVDRTAFRVMTEALRRHLLLYQEFGAHRTELTEAEHQRCVALAAEWAGGRHHLQPPPNGAAGREASDGFAALCEWAVSHSASAAACV
eukprot:TRINITY_DN60055_c0_g1_i1.p1 TRINITY_DN60055_c0_g1~~TRINITY_DN60055_c0_g1_i1.p1  ORF type:complete len:906 (+),score=157.06 TRINITY_DN60055_c0_g1_i1:79-2796(+)